jgi:hypothetical protein
MLILQGTTDNNQYLEISNDHPATPCIKENKATNPTKLCNNEPIPIFTMPSTKMRSS